MISHPVQLLFEVHHLLVQCCVFSGKVCTVLRQLYFQEAVLIRPHFCLLQLLSQQLYFFLKIKKLLKYRVFLRAPVFQYLASNPNVTLYKYDPVSWLLLLIINIIVNINVLEIIDDLDLTFTLRSLVTLTYLSSRSI